MLALPIAHMLCGDSNMWRPWTTCFTETEPPPKQAEVEQLSEAVRRIEGAARAVWPGCRAALFGSQATRLALPGADLDVVVLGASADLRRAGSGFTKVASATVSCRSSPS